MIETILLKFTINGDNHIYLVNINESYWTLCRWPVTGGLFWFYWPLDRFVVVLSTYLYIYSEGLQCTDIWSFWRNKHVIWLKCSANVLARMKSEISTPPHWRASRCSRDPNCRGEALSRATGVLISSSQCRKCNHTYIWTFTLCMLYTCLIFTNIIFKKYNLNSYLLDVIHICRVLTGIFSNVFLYHIYNVTFYWQKLQANCGSRIYQIIGNQNQYKPTFMLNKSYENVVFAYHAHFTLVHILNLVFVLHICCVYCMYVYTWIHKLYIFVFMNYLIWNIWNIGEYLNVLINRMWTCN